MRLKYRFRGVDGERLFLLGGKTSIDPWHSRVEITWRGEGHGQLVFLVVDASGEHHSFGPCPSTQCTEWLRWDVDLRGDGRAHWGGDGDGVLSFPLRRVGFVVWPDSVLLRSGSDAGSTEIKSIAVMSPGAAARQSLGEAAQRHREGLRSLGHLPLSVAQLIGERLRDGLRHLVSLERTVRSHHPDLSLWSRTLEQLETRRRRLAGWLELFDVTRVSIAQLHNAQIHNAQIHNAPRNDASEARAVVVTAHAADHRVRSGTWPALRKDSGSTTIHLWTMRGGVATVQIAVHTLEDLASVDLIVSPLEAATTTTAAAEPSLCVEWSAVEEARVDTGDLETPSCSLWPDALRPEAAVRVAADCSRAFWISVDVPTMTRSGIYEGVLCLSVDEVVHTVFRLRLEVLDVRLGERPGLKTLMGLDACAVGRFYGQSTLDPQTLERWVGFLARRRVHGDPLVGSCNWWHPPEAPQEPSPPAVRRIQQQSFGMVWAARASNRMLLLDDSKRREVEERWLAELPRWAAEVEGKGHEACTYLYTYDEPGAEDYRRIRPFLAACRRLAPGLKVVLTFYRDDPTIELAPFVDVWCPHLAWVEAHPQRVKDLQASGSEVWWYLTDDAPPFPSLRLEASSLHQRVLFWQTFYFGFTGLLHWESCHWHRNIDRRPRWPMRRWLASEVLEGIRCGSGNGSLLYPGPGKRPLSSLRLESVCQGSEDYDLLCLLDRRLRRGGLSADAAARARQLLDLSDLIESVSRFETDPEIYASRRRAIAEFLHHHPTINDPAGDRHAMREVFDLRQIRARAEGLGEPLPSS